ncbi:SRPBCC domain-containing protein [Pengzhenrongella sicca]|uniref:SRPBCC domain-containing protein n=1 Tax=Pengzhenrongella sicca TaxID=2819238 RepID=A0A8A4ZDT4_9MICO|nr:SRPBCC domain-containing protein [Pengzhenrongella sicca]QTE29475.1 SRPBCC domain-containing protein [Pengzhenrongella sicca]
MSGHVAAAEVEIEATPERVWRTLVDPDCVRQYMFGSEVVTDWRAGSAILFRGQWEGKAYEDKGVILDLDEPTLLRYTHYSPLSGAPDEPASYHTLTYALEPVGAGTRLTLTQDNNDTEAAAEHASGMWRQLLESVKALAEE